MPELIVTFRPITADDIPDKVRLYNDKEITRYLNYEEEFSVEQSLRWFEKVKNDPTRFENIIEDVENGKPRKVGIVGLFDIDLKNRMAGFYITIGERNYQGRGIARKVTVDFLTSCFLEFQLEKIYLFTHQENLRAQRLYERIGFVREGVLRHELYVRGRFINRYYYGILRGEFFAIHG